MQNYGTPFLLEKNKAYIFPDFTIEYIGDRKVSIPKFVYKDFIYRDYKLTFDNTEKKISWTSGTGLLKPLVFEVNGKRFSFQPWGINFDTKEISITEI